MFDIWGFLLQTLTVSGVAVVILVIKAMFKDKLSPKWHFAVWGVLGILLLLPAGFRGRYVVFNWRILVEILKVALGDFSTTQVLFPIPVVTAVPKNVVEWIFAGYVLGVVGSIVKYLISYVQLRGVLRGGSEPNAEVVSRIQECAKRQSIKHCKVIEVEELPCAFVCGIFRPVLVLPASKDVDDKIILHELLHLKYKDTIWTVMICFWCCIHWCNPFLVYCANMALNDMEARCDQHVLENLEGEERREYGHILLSMANEKYAKTPGSTCINNGGKNIRKRIESIARFKKYPVGMELVSACAIVLLTTFLCVGVQATEVHDSGYYSSRSALWSTVSARSAPCVTYAGAFDAYGKSLMKHSEMFRIMCATETLQKELYENGMKNEQEDTVWTGGLESWPCSQTDYYIYNLRQVTKDVYEALFVIQVNYMPDRLMTPEILAEDDKMYVASQKIRTQKENGRWVVYELEEFQYQSIDEMYHDLRYGCEELPTMLYTGTVKDIQVDISFQSVYTIQRSEQDNNTTVPKANGVFTWVHKSKKAVGIHKGTQEERDAIDWIEFAAVPVFKGNETPDSLLIAANGGYMVDGMGYGGKIWENHRFGPGWGPTFSIAESNTGGFGSTGVSVESCPKHYAAKLYVNKEFYGEMNLYLQEGGSVNAK